MGLEIWTNPGIYTDLEAKIFLGWCCMSIFIFCFPAWQQFIIRQLKFDQNMVWFWTVLFNWRKQTCRVPRSNYLLNGLVLFIKASVMDFYMRLDMVQIPQVVYIFYDMNGINPFWMWKHGLRTQSSAISTAPASPSLSAACLLSYLLALSSNFNKLIAILMCTWFWFIDIAISEFSPPKFIFFWHRQYFLHPFA